MKNCLLLLIWFLSPYVNGQTTNYKVTYLKSSNGKLIENQEPILVFTNELETIITNQKILNKKAELPFEVTVLDRKKPDKKIATIDST